jgi:hypothetical protein
VIGLLGESGERSRLGEKERSTFVTGLVDRRSRSGDYRSCEFVRADMWERWRVRCHLT